MKRTAWNKGLTKEKQPFYGKKHTLKHKTSMKGNSYALGKSHSIKTKEAISKSLIGNRYARGKYSSPYTLIKIKQTTCQCKNNCPWHKRVKCNFPYKEALEVDHINPKHKFPELLKEISNLQMLCANCHKMKSKKEKTGNNRYKNAQ